MVPSCIMPLLITGATCMHMKDTHKDELLLQRLPHHTVHPCTTVQTTQRCSNLFIADHETMWWAGRFNHTSATRPPLYRDQPRNLPIVYSTTHEALLPQDHPPLYRDQASTSHTHAHTCMGTPTHTHTYTSTYAHTHDTCTHTTHTHTHLIQFLIPLISAGHAPHGGRDVVETHIQAFRLPQQLKPFTHLHL